MFQIDGLLWSYVPFPTAYIKDAFSQEVWRRLASKWPDNKYFQKEIPGLGLRRTFSGKDDPRNRRDVRCRKVADNYVRYVYNPSSPWQDVYKTVKRKSFIKEVLDACGQAGIKLPHQPEDLSSRFEFVHTPAIAGKWLPNTLNRRNVLTLLFPFDLDWDLEWGGEIETLEAKEDRLRYNWNGEVASFHQFHGKKSYRIARGDGLLIVKTHDSWHGMNQLSGPEGVWQKMVRVFIDLARK